MFKKHLDWIELILAAAIVGSVLFYATRAPADAAATAQTAPRVNFRAPGFSLPMLGGNRIALQDLRGQNVLLNFWATWCVPCRSEMPEIQNAYAKYRNQNFTVLAINDAEDETSASKFVQQLHLTFPILLDDGKLIAQYQIAGLPASFFIDRDGIIRVASLGQMNREYIETQVAQLLATGQ